jgi:hypothetical protein
MIKESQLILENQKILSTINYPNFFNLSHPLEMVKNVKDEFYSYIINALHRFLHLSQMAELEQKLWLIAITTRKHGLIYYMNRREAQENLAFAAEHRQEIEYLVKKLDSRPKLTRDIINYAFHRFVYNPQERVVETSTSDLVSYDAITSIYSRKIAIRKDGPFDTEPDVSFYEIHEGVKNPTNHYDEYYDEHYDGHHLAHYIVALLGDYDYLDDDPQGSAAHLPKKLRILFNDPTHPFGSFVIFTRLLRPLFQKIYQGNNDEESIVYMATHLKDYLLAGSFLFDPKNNINFKPSKAINVVQLAVSVQSAIGEMPVSFAEAASFTRGANRRRPEDMILDELEKLDTFQRVYQIALREMSFFQKRSIIRQQAKLAAYLLVAHKLLSSSTSSIEARLLEEIIYRIQTCYGGKIDGKNLHHRLYESGLIYEYGYLK